MRFGKDYSVILESIATYWINAQFMKMRTGRRMLFMQ